MENTSRTMDTNSFAAGFITATIFFLLPILLVPSLKATYFEEPQYDISTQDIDTDGVDDAFDASFEAAPSLESDGTDDESGDTDEESDSTSSVEADVDEGGDVDAGFESSVMHEAAPGICEDGVDNDSDGDVDGLDDDCDEGTSLSSSSMGMGEDCSDGIDNDGDGDVDDLDDDCM